MKTIGMNAEYIENKILRLCVRPRTFEFISDNLDGLDPIRICESLGSLVKRGRISKKDDLWVIKEDLRIPSRRTTPPDPQLYLKKYMGYFDFLKIPHPLDFEWRNSTSSLSFLLSQVQELNTADDEILFLGLPTLFGMACQKDIPQRVTLVERNKPIVEGLSKINVDRERFRIIDEDVFKVKPDSIGRFYSVFMDPPWYAPFFYQFVWLAARCVKVGGIIGISLPPINTRPNVSDERLKWLSFCSSQGLFLENLSAQKVNYTMPFFEFNAFKAAGIKNIAPFWRSGDFAILRKINGRFTKRPLFSETATRWVEKDIEGVRFRIKATMKNGSRQPLKIKSLVNGDILPSVSVRDRRRERANVWTSGNRIFEINNPARFLSVLDMITPQSKNLGKEEKEAMDFVKRISALENREYNNYLDWLYHEMER